MGRVMRLARGLGASTALRFLRGLREAWPLARDLPLDPAAGAAARHLGLVAPDTDPESEAGELARAARAAGYTGELHALEVALAELGRSACRRERYARCWFGEECPAWEASV